MTTTVSFKQNLDVPVWRPCAPYSRRGTCSAGLSFAWDMRNDSTRIPLIYVLGLGGVPEVEIYNPALDAWSQVLSTSITTNAGAIFHPSQGPRGTITTGATTTSVVLSTALPAAVGINQLADRGDGTGYRMRIIGKSSGGSGKTEEVTITANTAGTAPTITYTPATTFTPASGDGYEIISGRIFYAATNPLFRYYDIATNSESAALSVTNMTASGESAFFATSEVYVSNDRKPGEGFLDTGDTYSNGALHCIKAGAGGSTTTFVTNALTNPSNPSLAANEYRNFQLRIVEDTTNPTNIGTRVKITSHTSGNTPTFTVATMPFAPTQNVTKAVLELNDDNILLRNANNLLNYSVSGNSWDASTTWAANGNSATTGTFCMPCFGITRDASGNRLHGQMFWPRGGNTRTIDLFDMTASSTGGWTTDVTYANKNSNLTFNVGLCGAYDPAALGGKYVYINNLSMANLGSVASSSYNWRFNVMSGTLEPNTFLPADFVLANPGAGGCRMATNLLVDGSTKVTTVFLIQNNRLADPGTTSTGTSMFALVAEGS